MSQVTDAHAVAGRGCVAVVGNIGRAARQLPEGLQALRFEALIAQQRRYSQTVAGREFPGEGRRNQKLRKIDAELARSAQRVRRPELERRIGTLVSALRIGGIHAAIAIDRDAERHVAGNHVVVAEFRNEKILLPAGHLAVQRGDGGAAAFDIAVGTEPVEAGIESITDEHHLCGIIRATEGVIGARDADSRHALGLHPVAVREITVCRKSDLRSQTTSGKQSGQKSGAFHGVPFWEKLSVAGCSGTVVYFK